MSSHAYVIDTNVVVAGLLTASADSPVARTLDAMLRAAFPMALSEPLLAEYRAVLLRPRIRARHGLSEPDIDLILTDIAQHAMVFTPAAAAPPAPDPGDQLLWNLLAAHAGLRLVTGDARLLGATDAPGPVLTPAAFVTAVLHRP